jgi:phenylpyruvate tautomerase PptA (4-oxalocrotonate tautomerase family)
MPSTRIETRAGWIAGRHEALIAAVQRALVEGILIPEGDRDIRILEYPPEAFAPPPGRGPAYTVIEISLFKGRSIEAKRRLYAKLAEALSAFGLGDRDLKIVLQESAREDWSVGGKALSDVELGFKVEV